jgi:succinate dehydrogenase/fumarate reductase flavoprotein subunit
VLEVLAEGLLDLPEFIASLGGQTEVCEPGAFGGMLPSWPHFPGSGHVRYRQFVPTNGDRPGMALWRILEAGVHERGVPVALETPVLELLTDSVGRICGAVCSDLKGARHTVRATRGVVLASGGFEYDSELVDTYLPLPLVGVGHPGNTGDTLRLATAVGTFLWHMSAFFGWLAFVHADHPAGFTLDVHAPSFIYLDGDGRRLADETGWEVHDKIRALTAYLPRRPNRPRLPGWIVFDEAARLAGPLHGIVGSPNDYRWSPDNAAEVAAGWIRRGDTPRELAAATGLDARILEASLAEYEVAAAAKRDNQFGRDPQTLVPLEPPLYAIPFTAGLATASGGPRRDAQARIVGRSGAIPGLFAAGAAGSVWGHLTEHGGGLGDALVFGRIAGAHCAAERDLLDSRTA